PASVQERWFAGLYLMKPFVFAGLSLFWIVTGILALGSGYRGAVTLMAAAGAGSLSSAATIAGCLADIAIGAGIAFRRSSRVALLASLGVSAVYVVGATLLLPSLWVDPLGPLVKIWAVVLLTLVALSILEDR
ncbi:MAG TPA: DoxX-like family protein, partial [Stellaceae bacterium]|nr:DoxX-like family protein [Stellaceae bacterium]